ncbi:MAG: DUF6602 domain-containing protein [Burkholderiales bacterium]
MAKKPSTINVQEYYDTLRNEFLLKAKRSTALPHLGERGRNEEERVRGFLKRVLPQRFSVGSGFIVSSNKALGVSPQMDVVIYDEVQNAPLHRELSSSVYPVEMVYATVEVKRLLQKKDLRKVLEDIQQIRNLGAERWYAAYAAIPKDASKSGKSITGQIQFKLSKPPPRSYLVAIRHKGWGDISAFVADLADALEKTPTHIHGIVVLDTDWYVTLKAYSTPRTGLMPETGNSLLRFVNNLLPAISSMPMYQMAFDRYLNAATPIASVARNHRNS